MVVFWVVTQCSLTAINGRFGGACYLCHQNDNRPDDGGNKYI